MAEVSPVGDCRPGGRWAAGPRALREALTYALGTAALATRERLAAPTPCRGWDLQMLLLHACESLAALTEGFQDGHIALDPGGIGSTDPATDPAAGFRHRARSLLGSLCRGSRQPDVATIGGCPLASDVLASAGALEVAVHGWDIAGGMRPPMAHPTSTC